MLSHVEVGGGKFGVGLVYDLYGALEVDKDECLEELKTRI